MESCLKSAPRLRSSEMIALFASKTFWPSQMCTSDVKLPSSLTGTTTGMPAASQTCWSSSPKPGAIWTMPVPSSAVTKSPASTLKAPGVSAKKLNNGLYVRSVKLEPLRVAILWAISPCLWAIVRSEVSEAIA